MSLLKARLSRAQRIVFAFQAIMYYCSGAFVWVHLYLFYGCPLRLPMQALEFLEWVVLGMNAAAILANPLYYFGGRLIAFLQWASHLTGR